MPFNGLPRRKNLSVACRDDHAQVQTNEKLKTWSENTLVHPGCCAFNNITSHRLFGVPCVGQHTKGQPILNDSGANHAMQGVKICKVEIRKSMFRKKTN